MMLTAGAAPRCADTDPAGPGAPNALGAPNAPSILAFGPAPWPGGWVGGSPRYHLYELAGAGWRVLYVEPPQGRLRRRLLSGKNAPPPWPEAPPGSVSAWPGRALWIYHPRTWLFFHPRLPLPERGMRLINRIALARLANEVLSTAAVRPELRSFLRPDILWLGAYSHAPLAARFPQSRRVAFLYDDLPASPAWPPRKARVVRRLETDLLKCADLSVFTSKTLLDSRASLCRRTLLLENACDASFFDDALPPLPAPDTPAGRALAALDLLPRPRIGYVGALNMRLDIDLCRALARAAEERGWTLVFAGPVDALYGGAANDLRQCKAVHFTGIIPPAFIPHVLRRFDALILPHVRSEFTRAMFPEKVPEYLATGRPIISTRLPEVERVAADGPPGAIEFASDPDEFIAACAQAVDAQAACAPSFEGAAGSSSAAAAAPPDLAAARIALARRHTRAVRLPVLDEALRALLAPFRSGQSQSAPR